MRSMEGSSYPPQAVEAAGRLLVVTNVIYFFTPLKW